MKTFYAILAFVRGIHRLAVDSPSQRPVMRSLEVFVYLCLNKRMSKQSRRWWFEMPSCTLWRHCNNNMKEFGLVPSSQDHLYCACRCADRTSLHYQHSDNGRLIYSLGNRAYGSFCVVYSYTWYIYDLMISTSGGVTKARSLTHLPWVPHMCVSQSGQHWFR